MVFLLALRGKLPIDGAYGSRESCETLSTSSLALSHRQRVNIDVDNRATTYKGSKMLPHGLDLSPPAIMSVPLWEPGTQYNYGDVVEFRPSSSNSIISTLITLP